MPNAGRAVILLLSLSAVVVVSLLQLGWHTESPTASEASTADGHVKCRPPSQIPREADDRLRDQNAPYHQSRAARRLELGRFVAPTVHVVAGGDCTWYTVWQAAGLEHSFLRHHRGSNHYFTRLVAGCEAQTVLTHRKAALQLGWGPEEKRFGVMFTPTAVSVPNSFDPYNHPAMLLYWARHSDFALEDYIFVSDLDAVFLRPIPVVHLTSTTRRSGSACTMLLAQLSDFLPAFDTLPQRFSTPVCPSCPSTGQWDALLGGFPSPSRRQFEAPYVLSSGVAHAFFEQWVAATTDMRRLDPNFWGIEWLSAAAAAAKVGTVRVVPWLTVSSAHQDLWDDNEVVAFRDPQPVQLHYGHRGVGWLEYGERLEDPRTLARYEQRHRRPSPDQFHFSKFRLPSDWPDGAARPRVWLLRCEDPILQNLPGDEGKANDANITLPQRRSARLIGLLVRSLNRAFTAWKRLHCAPNSTNLERRIRSTHPTYFVSDFDE